MIITRETITTPYRRMLLQGQEADDVITTQQQSVLSPDSNSQPINYKNPTPSSSPVDSSMALTILVLLTAIFFMVFFSIYIRRLAREEAAGLRRGSGEQNPPSSSYSGVGRLCANRKGKGLEPSTMELLPLVSYLQDEKQLSMVTGCSICLTEFEVKEIVRLIPHCKHLFHPQCLHTWLSSHCSCPLCRSTQLFLNDVDGQDDVCLDVKEVQGSTSRCEQMERRSTDDRNDTLIERAPLRFIKSCSYPNLGNQVVLQRSMSF